MVVILELLLVVVVEVVEAVVVVVAVVVVDLLAVLRILQAFHWVQYNKILWAQHFLSEACCCIPF